jgi:DNA-binding transcriptional LysR family regulator
MKLTLDALLVLDAIARRGTFAAAAQEMNRVPSALSYTMGKLEQQLGAALFLRGGQRATLTAAGHALLEDGRALLAAAEATESRVRQAAGGWERSFTLAVDDVLPLDPLWPLLARFYTACSGTALRLRSEVLSGAWESLLMGRCDLLLGATGTPPPGAGLRSRQLGRLPFVFAVAPQHPLARASEPLSSAVIRSHRAVAIADTAQALPARSVGLLPGQDVLTVSSLAQKLAAQIAGLGVGYLPRWAAQPALDAGTLLERRTARDPHRGGGDAQLKLAWRADSNGQALRWFLRELRWPLPR